MKCAVGPCRSERLVGSYFCSAHGPVPEFARGYEFPIEHPNFGIWGYLELDEPVTRATIYAFWDAWPPDYQSFEAFAGDEPNLLVVEFSVDLDDDIGDARNTAKAFAAARQSVLRVAAQIGLACRLRPLKGSEVGCEWFESL